ncbi:MAG TPA: polyprenyl synthetase family protein [Ktedonobacteraceae bacterium]|nr:polyprenyl synthetase family protein [Ktedonobacteraceae bacterium]
MKIEERRRRESSIRESSSLFSIHQQVLSERLLALIAPLPTELRADVMRALKEPGKLLAEQKHSPALPAGAWSLLTFLVAEHMAPQLDMVQAATTAVAIECYVCALDLFDDVEDGDQTPVIEDIGAARANNTATVLFTLAFRALRSLSEQGLPLERVCEMLQTLEDATLKATAGQHRDLLSEHRPVQSYTQTEGEEIAAQKAGSLMQLACILGALCGESNGEQLELFAALGLAFGIAQQLDNDAHDLQNELSALQPLTDGSVVSAKKMDFARGKKTLPVILAWQVFSQERTSVSDSEKQGLSEQALESGILATWGLSLYYRERAGDCLRKIEAQYPVSLALRSLLGFG